MFHLGGSKHGKEQPKITVGWQIPSTIIVTLCRSAACSGFASDVEFGGCSRAESKFGHLQMAADPSFIHQPILSEFQIHPETLKTSTGKDFPHHRSSGVCQLLSEHDEITPKLIKVIQFPFFLRKGGGSSQERRLLGDNPHFASFSAHFAQVTVIYSLLQSPAAPIFKGWSEQEDQAGWWFLLNWNFQTLCEWKNFVLPFLTDTFQLCPGIQGLVLDSGAHGSVTLKLCFGQSILKCTHSKLVLLEDFFPPDFGQENLGLVQHMLWSE